jgi:hypothetical protein
LDEITKQRPGYSIEKAEEWVNGGTFDKVVIE